MRFTTTHWLIAGAFVAATQLMAQSSGAGPISFSATADSGGAKDSIRIDLLRWSTDAERDELHSAWAMTGTQKKGPPKGAATAGTPATALTEEQLAACRRVDKGV